MFTPRLGALGAPQRELWDDLRSVPSGFVLYGGTALALRLEHRASEDFDFFANHGFEPSALEREAPFLAGAVRLQSGPSTLVTLVDRGAQVRVSFFGALGMRRVGDPDPSPPHGVLVASLLDLAATKLKVVQDRAESKDYLDVARLLADGIELGVALGAARAVFGEGFNPLLSLKALSYFGDGDLASLPAEIQSALTAAVRRVDPTRLPAVLPLPGGIVP